MPCTPTARLPTQPLCTAGSRPATHLQRRAAEHACIQAAQAAPPAGQQLLLELQVWECRREGVHGPSGREVPASRLPIRQRWVLVAWPWQPLAAARPTCLPMQATKAEVVVRPKLRPRLTKEMSRKSGAENLIRVGCEVGSLHRQAGRGGSSQRRPRSASKQWCSSGAAVVQRRRLRRRSAALHQCAGCSLHAGWRCWRDAPPTRCMHGPRRRAHRVTRKPSPLARPTSAAVLRTR